MTRLQQTLAGTRRGAAKLLWYVRELNGEHAYDRYAERARAAGEPVMTRREFEHRRTDRRDADPREGGTCC
ncbi:YbdD/YjiX family protein [Streptomyces sp. MST-110588]|uniref:YbdD/YjiX family protein n=1 Tax=Streptomyces sp. MST-110588 TaxID=2833628 RepID=UPI001F5D1B5D|nr:YbdD/YjiX family protein [Streptomyces sp. MST-110588]UNO40209.1 YbdD/YjiX family protein [Streptomyces sp. MST-110588]